MEAPAFPRVGDLPESEQRSFWNGLCVALHNTKASLSKPTAHDFEAESAPVIAMWKERAQMYAAMSLEERQQEAARTTARELFTVLMPGNTGISTADEVADTILAAIRKVV